MKRILISRTDSIGDVILTLPMCQALRMAYPEAEIIYIGKNYTRPVIACFSAIDAFWDIDELLNQPIALQLQQLKADCIIHVFPHKELAFLAKKAKIPMRIGTSHRVFHLFTCNERPNFTRKNSSLHEAQLNFHLLAPLGITEIPSMDQMQDLLSFHPVKTELPAYLSMPNEQLVILHPKSKGSALEWPLDKYMDLALQLAEAGKFVCFTGTEQEGLLFRQLIPKHPRIIDSTGKLTLEQLIYFISQSAALVACSTGPYHIAGVSGIHAIGLFSMRRPIDPGRWMALGNLASFIVFDPQCKTCKKGTNCSCIENISVSTILAAIG
ncbi:MAG: glycosyltransferase family 9 protein [Flavobacteriales bacterium]